MSIPFGKAGFGATCGGRPLSIHLTLNWSLMKLSDIGVEELSFGTRRRELVKEVLRARVGIGLAALVGLEENDDSVRRFEPDSGDK